MVLCGKFQLLLFPDYQIMSWHWNIKFSATARANSPVSSQLSHSLGEGNNHWQIQFMNHCKYYYYLKCVLHIIMQLFVQFKSWKWNKITEEDPKNLIWRTMVLKLKQFKNDLWEIIWTRKIPVKIYDRSRWGQLVALESKSYPVFSISSQKEEWIRTGASFSEQRERTFCIRIPVYLSCGHHSGETVVILLVLWEAVFGGPATSEVLLELCGMSCYRCS